VLPGSPAQRAGLQTGDAIISLGGQAVDSATTLTKLMGSHRPGDQVRVGWVDPSGKQHAAGVRLASRTSG